jgi:hypothetical protein
MAELAFPLLHALIVGGPVAAIYIDHKLESKAARSE